MQEKIKYARISSLNYKISITAFRLHFHLVLKILMPQRNCTLSIENKLKILWAGPYAVRRNVH